MIKQKRKKTSSQVICELFNLPTNQIIYQDYSCSYIGTIFHFGRIYVGQEHFCFNSHMFGFVKQFTITIDAITKLDIDKGRIIVGCKNATGNQDIYSFGMFVNIDFTYKLMHGLWKGQIIEAKILGSNQEDKQGGLEGELEEGSSVQVDFFNQQVTLAEKQILTKIYFPCSVQQYYDFFLADKADLLSRVQFLQLKNAKQTKMTDWAKNEELGRQVRQLKSLIKVKGVPMRSEATMHQIQTLTHTDKQIDVSIITRMFDVPYAAYFNVQKHEQIKYVDQKKCSLQIVTWVNFNKSTIMKKVIIDKTSKDIKQDYEYWIKTVQQRLKSKVRKTGSNSSNTMNPDLFEATGTSFVDFSKILDQSLDQKPQIKNQNESSNLKRLQLKINILISLAVLILCVQLHSYLK